MLCVSVFWLLRISVRHIRRGNDSQTIQKKLANFQSIPPNRDNRGTIITSHDVEGAYQSRSRFPDNTWQNGSSREKLWGSSYHVGNTDTEVAKNNVVTDVSNEGLPQ